MPFVTAGIDSFAEAVSFPFETRDDALAKAAALAGTGKESVTVTDVETGEVLAGEDLLAAIEALVGGTSAG